MNSCKSSIVIRDRLYGRIEFSADFASLFETPEMRRLRGVRMSIPPQFLAKAMKPCASRYEHSIGVAYLGQTNPEFESESLELGYAGLIHDIGHGPGSHVVGPPMKYVLGRGHEDFRWEILCNSELHNRAARIGVNLDRAHQLVESKLFDGLPDLDNSDNSPRFCESMGISTTLYDPLRLAQGLCEVRDQYCLRQDREPELARYTDCRRATYAYVYSPEHEAPYLMLRQAIMLMAKDDQLPRSFFTMTDQEALVFLEEHGNVGTRGLIAAATRHDYYQRVVLREVTIGLGERLDAEVLIDEIAAKCGIPEDHVCACVQGGRGEKLQTVPFVDLKGSILPLAVNDHMRYRNVAVYVAPEHVGQVKKIEDCVEEWSQKALFRQSA